MFYSKKYPITHLDDEFLTLKWERGYKDNKLFYQEQEIAAINTIGELKKGQIFNHPHLGQISLKLTEKPVGVDIIVNGLHCFNNVSHPLKKVKGIANYFYVFSVFCFISLSFTYLGRSMATNFNIFIELPIAALYITCGIFANKSQAWAVYTGFIVYCCFTLLNLLVLLVLMFPLFALIILGIKVIFIILMAPFLKNANELGKYKKFKQNYNSDLIDDI